MPKNTKTKTNAKSEKKVTQSAPVEQKNSIWDIIKFGESYTSLILGIIVVVIATILLLTFVRGKNVDPNLSNAQQQKVAVKNQQIISNIPESKVTKNLPNNDQIKPTNTINTQMPTKVITKSPTKIIALVKPTVKPTVKPIVKSTVKPTVKPTVKLTVKPTIAVKIVKEPVKNQTISGSKYTIKDGDTLWSIAENKYKSGYNWVDIQKANKISNADVLSVGTSITLPNVQSKVATGIGSEKVNQSAIKATQTNKIVGNNYTINKGDTLWDVAVRAYGDGYAWTKIAKANKLSNPDLIHSGNKLNIPRA